MDIAEFLLARIAEDEAVAREANGRVAWLTLRYPDGSMRYTTVGHQHHATEPFWFADGHGIDAQDVAVFYDSRRVLAECEAKRRIVEECVAHEDYAGYHDQAPDLALAVLRLLAQPYADHADYNSAWSPFAATPGG